MTLHNTAVLLKKGSIVSGIGLGVILTLVIFFKIGVVVKNILYPPKIEPANQAYGKLPSLLFPQSTSTGNLTYTKDTDTGQLPEFPDRLIVYPIVNNPPNLLNLETVKKKVANLGFVDDVGNPVPEIARGGPNYEWDEPGGFQRKIIFDIVSQNYTMTSSYLSSITALRADSVKALKDPTGAVPTVQGELGSIDSFPSDIDLDKTNNADPKIGYNTKPILYSILSGDLTPSTSLSDTQVIRVDLYQKDISYTLTAGMSGTDLRKFQDFEEKLPILYPHPPYSTMNFLVASGINQLQVVSANFTHQTINLDQEQPATYPIKSADKAFSELTDGKAYIAANPTNDSQIFIKNVYLAYYAGDKTQNYLMPIIVFEGAKGFYAYVSAVDDAALE
jgi:hypothetical protein